MQTKFDSAMLAEPATAAAAAAIRNCVHCGFCTATCPTYVLLGNELDSPRGRIYLIKEMLENRATPSTEVVKHLDRCLSCLSCETHCPSGVSYRRIIDKGRAYVEEHFRRPVRDRLLRSMLAGILPHPGRLRFALSLAFLAQPLRGFIERTPSLRPLSALLRLNEAASARRQHGPAIPSAATTPLQAVPTADTGRARQTLRIGLAQNCVEPVLDPGIQASIERLLRRAGCEIVRPAAGGCCGALSHHLGREKEALRFARAAVDSWHREIETGTLDAIVVGTSGCGPVIRDYGFLLRDDPNYAAKAARVSSLACDVTELLARIGLPPRVPLPPTIVGYHAPCSLAHGSRAGDVASRLLAEAGFEVRTPHNAHLCCGSAGVYNIVQSEIAGELGSRKAGSLAALGVEVIASGNIGCLVQIASAGDIPTVHVAQLLDWACGGARPQCLDSVYRKQNAEFH